jgi:NAD(P)-dependent dehydrogenase (short-subunit alcohol dehydrogenase family)
LNAPLVIVTGAGGGIGKATCHRLARDGFIVCAVDRDADSTAAVTRELGGSHCHAALDVTDLAAQQQLVEQLAAEHDLAGMVHLAAVLRRKADLDDITEDDWDAQIDTNLKATFFLNRAVARVLIDQGHGGSIVNFASQGWWSGGFGGSVVYAASKGGVVSMTRGLARTLAPHGVRVNVVAPGFVDTSMMRGGMSAEDLEESIEQVPLGRLATPEEIADTAAFLVGNDSRYMTGATLNVSGGQLMY